MALATMMQCLLVVGNQIWSSIDQISPWQPIAYHSWGVVFFLPRNRCEFALVWLITKILPWFAELSTFYLGLVNYQHLILVWWITKMLPWSGELPKSYSGLVNYQHSTLVWWIIKILPWFGELPLFYPSLTSLCIKWQLHLIKSSITLVVPLPLSVEAGKWSVSSLKLYRLPAGKLQEMYYILYIYISLHNSHIWIIISY